MNLVGNMSIRAKGIVVVVIPAIASIIFVGCLMSIVASAAFQLREVTETQNDLLTIYGLMTRMSNMLGNQSSPSGHSAWQTHERLPLLEKESESILKRLSAERYPELRSEVAGARDVMRRFFVLISADETGRKIPKEDVTIWLTDAQSLLRQIQDNQLRYSNNQIANLQALKAKLVWVAVSGLVTSGLLTAAVSWLFNRDLLRRIALAKNCAYGLAYSVPSNIINAGTDEVGQTITMIMRAGQSIRELCDVELAILNDAQDVLCALDQNLRVIVCGSSVLDVFGKAPADIFGASILTIFPEHSRDSLRSQIVAARERDTSFVIARSNNAKNNQQIFTRWNVRWIDTKRQYFCHISDVTAETKAQEKKELAFAAINHDLRTPLTSLAISLLKIQSNESLHETAGLYSLLERLTYLANTTKNSINDLLLLSKLERNSLTVSQSVLALFDFFKNKELAWTITSIPSRVSFSFDSDLFFSADEELLARTLSLLLEKVSADFPKHIFLLHAYASDLDIIFALRLSNSTHSALSASESIIELDPSQDILLISLLSVQKIRASIEIDSNDVCFSLVLSQARLFEE